MLKTIIYQLLLKQGEDIVPIKPPILSIKFQDYLHLLLVKVGVVQPFLAHYAQYPKHVKELIPIVNPFPFEKSLLLFVQDGQALFSQCVTIHGHMQPIAFIKRPRPLNRLVVLIGIHDVLIRTLSASIALYSVVPFGRAGAASSEGAI